MAAFPEVQDFEVLDLSQFRASHLAPILDEEVRVWLEALDWDFRPSADLVRRFVDIRALNGCTLLARGEPVGYAYYVCEDRKGLIGDLYVRERFRTPENEQLLLSTVVAGMMRTPHVRRIESQLMLLRFPLPQGRLAGPGQPKIFPRKFMDADLGHVQNLHPRSLAPHTVIDQWSERRQDEAAALIASAYRGHIDSDINDQYRSRAGARRFLFNIIQYPGCGMFFQPAARVAIDRATNRLCGVSLTSVVADSIGHITQICLAPAAKGQGIGYELLRNSLVALAACGCRKVSLTVTAANRNAVNLYERVGFSTARQFPAMVWESF